MLLPQIHHLTYQHGHNDVNVMDSIALKTLGMVGCFQLQHVFMITARDEGVTM